MSVAVEHEWGATLTAKDRCDRCGAQAYAKYELTAGDILFCAHHNREYGPAAAKVAHNVVDETMKLDDIARKTEEDIRKGK